MFFTNSKDDNTNMISIQIKGMSNTAIKKSSIYKK